jgi:hypothetical protein
MGLTVYYRGMLDDHEQAACLINELREIAEICGWEKGGLDEDWTLPPQARVVVLPGLSDYRIVGHLALKGVEILPHPSCEPVSFYFDSRGTLWSVPGRALSLDQRERPDQTFISVKTQFAPAEIHVAIVKLLRYIKGRYISNLEVRDEGGFWETGDIVELERRRESINRALDMLKHALSATEVLPSTLRSAEQVLRLVEDTLHRKGLHG